MRSIIEEYSEKAVFLAPDIACSEAEEHLRSLMQKRHCDAQLASTLFRAIVALMNVIGSEVYGAFETDARERLGDRDPEDWPILASAIATGYPIWTEDADFFGCGVATWNSARVRIYFRTPADATPPLLE